MFKSELDIRLMIHYSYAQLDALCCLGKTVLQNPTLEDSELSEDRKPTNFANPSLYTMLMYTSAAAQLYHSPSLTIQVRLKQI